jgi:hypothetical protein
VIELFDAKRLLPRRDSSLLLAGGALGLGLAGLGVHAVMLAQQLQQVQADGRRAQTELARLKTLAPAPAAALLADLEQQALRLEAELLAAGANPNASSPSASQWLEKLDALSQSDIGLTLVEIDRAGAARIEGQARTPEAMSGYVQAWDRQQAASPLRTRGLEVRQDDKAAPLLRFQLRANLAGPKT